MKKEEKRERPKRPNHKFFLPFDTAYEIYWEYRNSDWKTLPEAGGLLDQDPLIMGDLHAIAAWLDYIEHDLKYPESAPAPPGPSFRDLQRTPLG